MKGWTMRDGKPVLVEVEEYIPEPPVEVMVQVGQGDNVLEEHSPTWGFIKEFIAKRLAELRVQNNAVSLDEKETILIRGQIKMLKELAKLPDKLAKGRNTRPQTTRLIAGEEY